MNAEQKYQIFQIKPGKAQRIAINRDDPKGIRSIQEILKRLKNKENTLKEVIKENEENNGR